MHLLVGLGNPGREYAGHRHNVGFMAADEIVRRHGFSPWRAKFHGEVAEGRLPGVSDKVLVLKPTTYMNESGRAVLAAMTFFKLAPADIVVFHDELDLAPGKVRVKRGGGHAGNNGLRSTIGQIGPDFVRVRIGIGHPGDKGKVTGYVLHDFPKADRDGWVEPVIDTIADHAGDLLGGREELFTTRVNEASKPYHDRLAAAAKAAEEKQQED